MEKMFEKGLKGKYRFSYRGSIGMEDLYDLSVKALDEIFKCLNSKLKTTKEESLLDVKTVENTELETKIAIVKHIVQEKLELADRVKKAKETKEEKQKIMAILKSKEEDELKNKSPEELRKILEEM